MQRAEDERQKAEKQKQRAENEKLKAEKEKQRADDERQKAEKEKLKKEKEMNKVRELVLMLYSLNISVQEIATKTGLIKDEIIEIISSTNMS
jgi:sRNA-binding protein